jgi:hypothetical protein
MRRIGRRLGNEENGQSWRGVRPFAPTPTLAGGVIPTGMTSGRRVWSRAGLLVTAPEPGYHFGRE